MQESTTQRVHTSVRSATSGRLDLAVMISPITDEDDTVVAMCLALHV